MKIAFLEGFLNIRGTSVALYDYAHYNEAILGNQSIILTEPFENRSWHPDASEEVQQKFRNRFPVFTYTDVDQVSDILTQQHVDVLYMIKGGKNEGVPGDIPNVKTIVHVVFEPVEPHGNFYCVISDYINVRFGTNFPVLPHIVHVHDTTDDFRKELDIPDDAVVFGRYGGIGEFDSKDAQGAVARLSQEDTNRYFLFMNTYHFIPPSKNVIYMSRTTDPYLKAKFINTCDAMIYGRVQGETFGLAIGEFSCRNKPIIAPLHAPDKMHQMILGGDTGIWYANEEECYEKMKSFRKDSCKDWRIVKTFG